MGGLEVISLMAGGHIRDELSLDPVDRKAKITFRVSKSGNDPLTGKPYSKLKAVNELFGNGLGFCTKELWELQFPSFLTVQLEKKSNQTLAVTNPIRYKNHVYRRVSGRFKDFKSEIVLPRSPARDPEVGFAK